MEIPVAMALSPGTHVGPYEILAPLGAGGMGEVYRARDKKLARDVALKILPPAFVANSERMGRFQREAQLLASLNHQNIAAIYGLEESGGTRALVMELVEGQTLAERTKRGPVPLDEALNIARQIAEALETAHDKGIIHRDLKPENIKVTPEGKVKVLDFGLAKAMDTAGGSAEDLSRSPTLSVEGTKAGVILGTAGYMSPEQARGKPVDRRTDIWAFGCLLYELLTGQRAFKGETLSDTIARVLEREPDWQALPAKTPAKIRELLRRCLHKDAVGRPQDIAAARRAIEEVIAPLQRVKHWQLIAAAAIVLAVVVGAAVGLRRPAPVADRSDWVPITNLPDSVIQPALSPDGRMLVFLRGTNTFMGQAQVYVKMLPAGEPVQLTHDDSKKMSPVFSPDGSRIAYTVVGEREGWDTWVVPVLGGTPQLWLPNASGLNWTDRQRLLFSEIKSGSHMAIVTSLESRAESRDIYVPAQEEAMAHRSYLSPEGKWVLIVEHDAAGIWMPCRLEPFEGSSPGRQVGPPGICTSAGWSPDGKWMYFSAAKPGDSFHIWRQRFPDGRPEQITSGPTEEEGIAVSPDGLSLITAVALRQRPISFHDGSGDRQVSLEGYSLWPRFYAAGRKVCYRISRSGAFFKQTVEIWLCDLDSGHNEPLLPGFQAIFHDISQDGRLLVAARDAHNKPGLWLARLDRRSAPRQIPGVESEAALFAPFGDILFLANEGSGRYLFRIHEDGTRREKVTPELIVEIHSVSPDGKWVAGVGPIPAKETGSFVYAYSTTGRAPVPVCREPCILRWAPDGKFLYLSIPGGFMSFGAVGRTYVVPTRPGSMFPDLPAGGFKSEAEIAAVPGVRVIDAADMDPGPSPDVYVFSREVVQRNLYRIPLR